MQWPEIFFQVLRANLKLVDNITVTPGKKKEIKLWEFEPLLLSIKKRWCWRERPLLLWMRWSTPLQVILSWNCLVHRSQIHGLKVSVLTTPDGLILDFEWTAWSSSSNLLTPWLEEIAVGFWKKCDLRMGIKAKAQKT